MTTETSNAREWVLVPREVVDFLMGEGELHGAWFGETPTGERGQWFWRKHLRLAKEATAPPPAAALEDVRGLVARVAQLREAIESEPEHCFGVNVRAGRAYGVRENLLCIVGLIEAALAAEGVQAGEVGK